jgi:hypothetical protein
VRKYDHQLCDLYGRFTFSLYAKIKPLSEKMINVVKISVFDLNSLHFSLLKLPFIIHGERGNKSIFTHYF